MPYCIHCGSEVEEEQEICLHCVCYAKPRMDETKEKVENVYDSYARQGFILSIAGFFIPILMIVGFIFSIKGLQSTRNKKRQF